MINTHGLFDSADALLYAYIYPREIKACIYSMICKLMIIKTLLLAKTRINSSISEQINTLWYIHKMESLLYEHQPVRSSKNPVSSLNLFITSSERLFLLLLVITGYSLTCYKSLMWGVCTMRLKLNTNMCIVPKLSEKNKKYIFVFSTSSIGSWGLQVFVSVKN